jgi:hypothetical protein
MRFASIFLRFWIRGAFEYACWRVRFGFVFLVFVGRGGIVISNCCGERVEHQIAVAEHSPNCGTLATVMIVEDGSHLCILSSTY